MKRIQRKRTKGWRMPANTKYVGRGTKWGNPYRLSKDDESNTFSVWQVNKSSQVLIAWAISEKMALDLALEKYAQYIDRHINYGNLKIEELKGKNLACFCSLSSRCHADILLERCK